MAPVSAKPLSKPASPEKKYIIERKVKDDAEEIEMEITKELQKSRAVSKRSASQTRQVSAAVEESSVAPVEAKGRKRRIKTIKKFGQVIGREEQIIDEDGNIISSKKMGMDENEYFNLSSYKSNY